jgi:recombinational DNA repair protein RecR
MCTDCQDDPKYRKNLAKLITRFWFSYKVCEGCDSIVVDETAVCPVCKAYRFDTTKKSIIKGAKNLATNPRSSVLYTDFL